MKINFTEDFLFALEDQVDYIAQDKPKAAKKFKNDLLKKIKKDIQNPFLFQRSQYFDNENIRDYVFKGYVSVYEVDIEEQAIFVFKFIKYRNSI
ncbi:MULTISPECIES: type II toxin-antitoxin system RelE/ParE family toxin [unclassified Flavobacterium]|uniref:type II toxin-antitoxin system RelE/ParE family toxin n=1 Tax=unclassified Flavobacterium TaxID=196869 RepID=UPI0006ABC13B|nr:MULTISPECIES: type II toxin-antitoxin system RelE/ParE family toxin [unclassified Flavobacterium]KOP36588.1 plasmid stabilization protein [Flavobacterium sp. VMW]OWU91992.1 plasmid stabilization protein [Flavobacterium sp. NLM]